MSDITTSIDTAVCTSCKQRYRQEKLAFLSHGNGTTTRVCGTCAAGLLQVPVLKARSGPEAGYWIPSNLEEVLIELLATIQNGSGDRARTLMALLYPRRAPEDRADMYQLSSSILLTYIRLCGEDLDS